MKREPAKNAERATRLECRFNSTGLIRFPRIRYKPVENEMPAELGKRRGVTVHTNSTSLRFASRMMAGGKSH
jgi:hypothetical protein